jgi:predicted dehydrogenase
MLTALESGAIGEVEAIDGEVGYLLPDVRSDWYREKEHSGGGTLIDNSPHLLDVVGQILRVNGGDRIRRARCRTAHDALGLAVEDMAGGELLTERGRRIGLAATWADGEYRMNLTVRGARGRLSLVGFETLVVETDDGATETRSYADTPANESWALDIQAFVEAILFDRAPRASGEEGAQCVRIIEALYASAGRGGEDVVL